MSNITKIAIGVVAVIIVGSGIWWWAASRNSVSSGAAAINNETPIAGTTPTTASTTTATSTPPVDNSDGWMEKEMAQVNTQMGGFASDSASINQGMNDQPIPQGQ